MLRKALDAAEKQQQLLPPVDSETTSLATGNDEYGSLAKTSEGDDESGVEDSTFAFGDDDDDDDDDEMTIMMIIIIKALVMLMIMKVKMMMTII